MLPRFSFGVLRSTAAAANVLVIVSALPDEVNAFGSSGFADAAAPLSAAAQSQAPRRRLRCRGLAASPISHPMAFFRTDARPDKFAMISPYNPGTQSTQSCSDTQ